MTDSEGGAVDPDRLDVRVDAPVRAGDYVLYWMTAARRTRWSPALQRAVALARAHRRPLLVLEAVRRGYRWAAVRHHRLIVDGMADQARAFAAAGVRYHAYVEPTDGEGQGLLEALAARAIAVVADDFPAFFLPHAVDAAATRLRAMGVRLEVVDGVGLLPMRAGGRAFTTAASFRRHLHKVLPRHLRRMPVEAPLAGYDLGMASLPDGVAERWPHAAEWIAAPERLSALGLPGPGPVPYRGGAVAGEAVVQRFLAKRLDGYLERNHPDQEVASGLSPHLHFGHVSAHDVVSRVLARESWTPERLGPVSGSREGWWGLSPAAEGFLDELVTWRELGYGFCHHVPRYDRYDTLPDWARTTLDEHRADPRPTVYDLGRLEAAGTGDPLWNAAQRQLVAEGRIHNYLRMLWGKRVLEWSATPEEAWDVLIELNNRYAADGRDPNSYSGIAWTFGRFDRAWGPERPIFGKVRYMTSDNTRRKLDLRAWLARWSR